MRGRSTAILTAGALALGLHTAQAQLGIPSQAEQQGVLAGVISRLLTTPTARVEIGGIEGVLSRRATITGIRVGDEDGIWLSLARAEIDWSLTALLRGRLEVSELTLSELEITRRPVPTDRPEDVAEGPLVPEVPIEVVVDAFTLDRLTLGEQVLGTPAELSAQGSARLGAEDGATFLAFEAQRLDAEGTLSVDLDYSPQTTVLSLDVTHAEPEGGIVARLLDLPGLPPVSLTIAGEAPLEAFDAQIALEAGPEIGAQGRATVRRTDAAYALDLDVAARIAALVPETAAPLFAGTTQLVGEAAFGDDGAIAITRLALGTEVAELALAGTVAPDRALDLVLSGETRLDTTLRLDETAIDALALDLSISGFPTAPRLAGFLDGQGVALAQGRVERLRLDLDVAPEAATTPAERYRFEIDAQADGIAATDPALAAALGDSARIEASGTADVIGIADVTRATIETPTLAGTYSGIVAARTLDGLLEARIPSLEPFGEVAGLALAGSAELTARLGADPAEETLTAALQGRLSDFATGITALDGLFGPDVTLTGTAALLADGIGFDGLRLDGDNLALTLHGSATQTLADLALDAQIPRLAALHPRIDGGEGVIEARLTGSLERPNLTARATLTDVVAVERPVPRLDLTIESTGIGADLDARIGLDGTVSDAPARGGLRVLGLDEGWSLEDIDVSIGSVALTGALRIGDDLRSEGGLRLAAEDLDDLSPLVLAALSGRLEAAIDLVREADGSQSATLEASGQDLAVEAIGIGALDASIAGTDLIDAPRLDGEAVAERVAVFGEAFERVEARAISTAAETDFTVSARAGDLLYETSGTLVPETPVPRLDLRDISVGPAPD